MSAESRDLIFCGVGGQGIILASKLVSQTALDAELPVRTAETIGMAQRGGSVTSHVRIGAGAYSPLVPLGTADAIIAFEPAEAVRCLPYLAPGRGAVVVSKRSVPPVTAALARREYDGSEMLGYLRECGERVIVVDGDAVCAACGSPKVLNTALLGAAAEAGVLGFSADDLERVIRRTLPERFVAMNVQALALGAGYTRGDSR
ncbi:MAG: indolepyruvate oxidoreductase subunit beta [Coriobacteriia bacterium]